MRIMRYTMHNQEGRSSVQIHVDNGAQQFGSCTLRTRLCASCTDYSRNIGNARL